MKRIFLSLLLATAFSAHAMETEEKADWEIYEQNTFDSVGKEVTYNLETNQINAWHHGYTNRRLTIHTQVIKDLKTGEFQTISYSDEEKITENKAPNNAIVAQLKKLIAKKENELSLLDPSGTP